MIIFNMASMVQVMVGALVGAAVAGLLSLMGFDFTFWLVLVTFAIAAPLDVVWRLAGIGGGDDEEEGGGSLLDLVLPGGGGHLFFLPVWGVGIAVVVASFLW